MLGDEPILPGMVLQEVTCGVVNAKSSLVEIEAEEERETVELDQKILRSAFAEACRLLP